MHRSDGTACFERLAAHTTFHHRQQKQVTGQATHGRSPQAPRTAGGRVAFGQLIHDADSSGAKKVALKLDAVRCDSCRDDDDAAAAEPTWEELEDYVPPGTAGFTAFAQAQMQLANVPSNPKVLPADELKPAEWVSQATKPRLQPYQETVAYLCRPGSVPNARMLVVHRTGSGKTATMIQIADNCARARAQRPVLTRARPFHPRHHHRSLSSTHAARTFCPRPPSSTISPTPWQTSTTAVPKCSSSPQTPCAPHFIVSCATRSSQTATPSTSTAAASPTPRRRSS